MKRNVILCGALGAETAQISPEARSHLTEVISVLQREWLHRDTMDWERLRQRVFAKAGAAQTIPETYDAIRFLLTLLGDKHSHYVTASGENIVNPQSPTQSTGECTPAPLVTTPIPADVGTSGFRSRRLHHRPRFKRRFARATVRPHSAGLWICGTAAAAIRGPLWPGSGRCSVTASQASLSTGLTTRRHGGTRVGRPG